MELTTIGDIVSISKGKKHSSPISFPTGKAKRYIQIEDLRNDFNLKYTDEVGVDVNENDVVIAWDGANAGTIGFDLNGYIGSTLARLRIKNGNVHSKYLGWLLRGKFNYLRSQCTGATIPHINKSVLEKISVPLPALKTQIKIASILEQADAARQKRKQANQLTEQFLQSVFLEMFGDPVRNEKGWEVKKISDFVKEIISGWSAQSEQRLKEKGEFGVLKVSAVTYGVFNPEEHKAVLKDSINRKLIYPLKGDVLMTRANTREMVAACCIVDKDYKDLFLSDKHWKVIFKPKMITAEYFRYVIMNNSYHEVLANKSTGTSGSMYNISKDKLLDTNFPLPPLPLQQKFASILEQVEQLRTKQRESEKELENLFGSLMQRYFG
ncbi:MAG: restriction endonuclease subunit S [Bacteroidia bacterium]